MVIELESQGSLAAGDVVRKLGQPGELRAPAHSGPNDEAVAYVYKIPAGELRFAIGRSDREPVLSIVIDQSG